MNGLSSILLFCDSGAYADETCSYINRLEESVVMVTVNPQRYKCGRIFFSSKGNWNLTCLKATESLWLSCVLALRGDVRYSEDALNMILAHLSETTAYIYWSRDEVVAICAPRKMLVGAMEGLLIESNDGCDVLVKQLKEKYGKAVSSTVVAATIYGEEKQ